MNQNLSRRDFLKIAGAGLGALASLGSNPLKPSDHPLALPQFPTGDHLGRVFSRIDVRSEPNLSAPSVKVLYDDEIVVCKQEVISGAIDPNVIAQRWMLTADGYIYVPHFSR